MNTHHIKTRSIVAGIALSLGTLTGANADTIRFSDDPVIASFEREFNHQSVPAAPATRSDLDQDPLYAQLNAVHWTDTRDAVRALADCQMAFDETVEAKLVSDDVRSGFIAACFRQHVSGSIIR